MRRLAPIALAVLLGLLAWLASRALATPRPGSLARPAAEHVAAADARGAGPELRAASDPSDVAIPGADSGAERVASPGFDPRRAPIEGRVQAPLGADPLVDYALSVGPVRGPFERVVTDALGHFATQRAYETGLVRVQHLDERFAPATHLPLTTLDPTPMPLRSEAFPWRPHGEPLAIVGAAGPTVRIEFGEPCPYADDEVLVRVRAVIGSRSSSRVIVHTTADRRIVGDSFDGRVGSSGAGGPPVLATQAVRWSVVTRLRRDARGAWARFPAVERGWDRGSEPLLLSVESLDGAWMQERPYDRGLFLSGRPGEATVVPVHASRVWVGASSGGRSLGLPVALRFGPVTQEADPPDQTSLGRLGAGWWELVHTPPGPFTLRGGGLRYAALDMIGRAPVDGRVWIDVPARKRPVAGALAGTLVLPDDPWSSVGEVNGFVELLRPGSDLVLETTPLKWEELEGGALECWFYFSALPPERFELRVAGQEERVAADPPNDEVVLTWR